MSKVAPHFDAIVELIASGLSIPKALASNPAFPKMQTFKWYAYHADFPDRARRVAEAQANRSVEARCARYADEIAGLVEGGMTIGAALASNPKFPHRSKFRLFVLANRDLDQRINSAKPLRSKMAPHIDELKRRVDRGQSIGSALDALPVRMTTTCLAHFVKKNAGHAQWMADIKARRARQSDHMTTAPLLRHDKRERQCSRSLLSNDLYRRVAAAVPRITEATIREDVITDIVVAVLSGDLAEEDISAEAKRRSAAYFKEDRFKHRSIYAPIFRDATASILDTHSDDIQNWGL